MTGSTTQTPPNLQDSLACRRCDWLLSRAQRAGDDAIHCPRCASLLSRRIQDGSARTGAFAITAIIALGFALTFPFLGFNTGGQENSMSLLQAGTSLMESGQTLLGLLVLISIVALPLLVLLALLSMAFCLTAGEYYRWLPRLGRVLYEIEHWSMVEVFLIGVLVSLTKIASMASIQFGVSFWAFVVFCAAFVVADSSLDRDLMWRTLAQLRA